MFSIQCLLRAVTQQMDNVALCCLLAIANVAVSYCRDGLCRNELWAKCLLTHSPHECDEHTRINKLVLYV